MTAVLGGAAYRDNNRATGSVSGWRLPSVHELASLVDPTRSNPALPAGHPFTNVVVSYNGDWTESTDVMGPNVAWALDFID